MNNDTNIEAKFSESIDAWNSFIKENESKNAKSFKIIKLTCFLIAIFKVLFFAFITYIACICTSLGWTIFFGIWSFILFISLMKSIFMIIRGRKVIKVFADAFKEGKAIDLDNFKEVLNKEDFKKVKDYLKKEEK